MEDFAALADRIARTDAAREADVLLCGLDVLGPPIGSREHARLERLVAIGAHADCALMLHRLALPHHGFELGQTAAGARARAFAGSWRLGDAQIAASIAATPALALLQATLGAMARSRRESERATCAICNGRGWYVTARSTKEICRHAAR
jgi:hypothetical protein